MDALDRELLRRMVIGDPRAVDEILSSRRGSGLDDRTASLVRLAAIATLGGGGLATSAAIEACQAAGVGDEAIAAVLDRTGRS